MNAYFGQGTGQIVLDNVRCTGSENQLLSCNSAPILDVSSRCDHSDDAGVRCEGIYHASIINLFLNQLRVKYCDIDPLACGIYKVLILQKNNVVVKQSCTCE